jgi:outer membrane protein assembly factor BamB
MQFLSPAALPVLMAIFSALAFTPGLHAASLPAYFRSDGGVAPGASGPLPNHLNAPDALRWRVPLDSGQSTPIVAGGKIFITTFNAESKELATIALEESSGRILWKRPAPAAHIEVSSQIGQRGGSHAGLRWRAAFCLFRKRRPLLL